MVSAGQPVGCGSMASIRPHRHHPPLFGWVASPPASPEGFGHECNSTGLLAEGRRRDGTASPPGQTRDDRSSGSPLGVVFGRLVLFDNPVVGHTRITHIRVWLGQWGLFRVDLIIR